MGENKEYVLNPTFPDGFIWGTATSSYQIEGAWNEDGRKPSIWDTYCRKSGSVQRFENGDVACDHYHRYKEDVALMAKLGIKAYRFSISWSRIIPDGFKDSPINEKGIEFYNNLINELVKNGIEPLVTLYHWDLPQTLEDDFKGFLSLKLVPHFVNYAKVCFESFGDRVKLWVTFNEPWCVCSQGYASAMHAPGSLKNPGVEPYLAAHTLLLAHAETYRLYEAEFKPIQKGVCGITMNAEWFEPVLFNVKDENDVYDRKTKQMALDAMDFTLGWFAEPIFLTGDYPEVMKNRVLSKRKGLRDIVQFTEEEKKKLKGSSDFFGLNNYSTQFVCEPRSAWKSISFNLGALRNTLNLLFYSSGSRTMALKTAYATVFSDSYLKDMGLKAYPYFYVNTEDTSNPRTKVLDKYETVDYGKTDMIWQIYPLGLRKLLSFIQDKYHPTGGITITENGCAIREKNVEDAVNVNSVACQRRMNFFEKHVKEVKMAIDQGIKINGYFAWSFMDNFEWSMGYTKRFGLVHVDYKTLERTPRPVAYWFQKLVTENKIPDTTDVVPEKTK